MTFIPLTPSVGKEKRILGGAQKVNSESREEPGILMLDSFVERPVSCSPQRRN
jgi:hypothetical protein